MKRKELTIEQHQYVEKHYARKGAKHIAKYLGASEAFVYKYVARHGIATHLVPEGRMLTSEAAAILRMANAGLWRTAKRHGVLVRHGRERDGKAKYTTVPIWWVDKRLKALDTLNEAEYVKAGWLTSRQAGKYIGISGSAISRALTRRLEGLPPRQVGCGYYFKKARFVVGRRGYFIHPQDVEEVRITYDKDRHAAKNLITLQDIEWETSVPYRILWRAKEELGIQMRKLPNHQNIFTGYFTKEQANRIKRYVAEN